MLRIGCHISSAKGYLAMGKAAHSIGANTFQFFTRNPRGSRVKAFDREDLEAMKAYCADKDIGRLLAHAPYTLNAGAGDERIREFARTAMREDLERLEYIPGCMYNFHPGSHVGQGEEVGILRIADILNQVMWPEQKTTILLETMAGKGSEVGRSFEEIRRIMDKTVLGERLGVCLDTCHVWDGGYDIVNHLEDVLEEFDRVIGLDRLRALHLNDSKNPLGSHKDRHERIGEGYLGTETFRRVVTHPVLGRLPCYLETPNELDGYGEEIRLLRSMGI